MSNLFRPGNEKTGSSIHSFNLPRVETCPGATELCLKGCYTKKFNRFPQVAPLCRESYEASAGKNFVERAVQEIEDQKISIMRIHVSGDFYSADYVRKWRRIVSATPSVTYYSYTRSWRCQELIRHLESLRRLPNMQLWWSTDREAGQPPEGRVAYMSTDDEDRPEFGVNLVFRVNRRTLRKTIRGVRVCPKEACNKGHPEYPRDMTCGTCRICFRDALKQAAARSGD